MMFPKIILFSVSILTLSVIGLWTIECNDGNPCTDAIKTCNYDDDCEIACAGTSVCEGATFNCREGKDCNIHCEGEKACRDAVFNCPSGGKCIVQSLGSNSFTMARA
eukprot:413932_1